MVIYRNIDELINFVASCVGEGRKSLVISVDGVNGSGKSYLAWSLSNKYGYAYIDIDGNYLIQNNGKYIDFIKYNKLSEKITALSNTNKIMVVDGICILRVLNTIEINPDIKIYVKKIHFGHWRDGNLFDYKRNIDELLVERRESLEEFENISAHIEGRSSEINDSEEDMSHEIIRYHYEYKPDINADIVFERDVSR